MYVYTGVKYSFATLDTLSSLDTYGYIPKSKLTFPSICESGVSNLIPDGLPGLLYISSLPRKPTPLNKVMAIVS